MENESSWLPEIAGHNFSHIVARSTRHVDRLKRSLAEHLRDKPRLLESLPAVAALVAAAAPWADDDAIYLASRMNLWVFMIDDRFDTSSSSQKDLDLLAAGCVAVAEASARTTSGDPILIELANLRRALRAHRMFDSFGRQWAHGVSRMVDAMLQEWRWVRDFHLAGRAALPTFDEYLEVGQDSVGVMPHIWLTCIISDDTSCARHVSYLERMASIANRCVRLANDLRSAEREASEGGINALVILSSIEALEGTTTFDAASWLQTKIAAGLAELETLRNHSVTDTGRAENSIADIARYICEFYGHRDFYV
jgi:Terpene synthase family 2, C-terminal metal binding